MTGIFDNGTRNEREDAYVFLCIKGGGGLLGEGLANMSVPPDAVASSVGLLSMTGREWLAESLLICISGLGGRGIEGSVFDLLSMRFVSPRCCLLGLVCALLLVASRNSKAARLEEGLSGEDAVDRTGDGEGEADSAKETAPFWSGRAEKRFFIPFARPLFGVEGSWA